ncbi:glutamate-5-semialdehyde dehydrogenase [uncultured Ellagibacter sp.]|uniref:glutamate-5-semialdehyde dehydrogenase n=1 Tax=uncultured Ellagibacter sp. TaxID=2137580 RepID=UPI00260F2D1F|nr:glutamate-5-semialdehyde dehydrogenase [uncultured Ellagibacter sp.]
MYEEIEMLAKQARAASVRLAQKSDEERNGALRATACALRASAPEILEANAADVAAAREKGTKESLIDRLALDDARVRDIASALESLAELPDPLGRTLEQRTLESGIRLERVSVPLGVVAVVYEARPNVTADAAGICLKSGNACVLRGGSMAARSCAAIASVLARAAEEAGMPEGSIGIVASTDRAATDVLMGLHGLIDVLVPRGGAGLIRHCVETAKVPVIETGTGNCHVYVHESADFDMARKILVNAKCRRFGVCNACETLLVDASVAGEFLPEALSELADRGVVIHADEQACEAALAAGAARGQAQSALRVDRASEQDWETEYLGPEIAVKCVAGIDEAIAHVNRYGTMHSEAIVANPSDPAGALAIERFLNEVDAAAVYANASTAFTDGGMFGLGAEIGISTQKLHVRGPFATEGLTSSKYVLRGDGQVRA